MRDFHASVQIPHMEEIGRVFEDKDDENNGQHRQMNVRLHETVMDRRVALPGKSRAAMGMEGGRGGGIRCGFRGRNKRIRPDTRHKLRLVCVLFTFENNTGRTYGPTDGRTRPIIEMRRPI